MQLVRGQAEDDAPVQVIMEEGKSMVKVTLHLTKEKPPPGKDVSLLGFRMISIITNMLFYIVFYICDCVMGFGECDKPPFRGISGCTRYKTWPFLGNSIM